MPSASPCGVYMRPLVLSFFVISPDRGYREDVVLIDQVSKWYGRFVGIMDVEHGGR